MKPDHEVIARVQAYFIEELTNGEYVIEKVGMHTATIIIDEVYTFEIWLGSRWCDCEHYTTIGNYPVRLPEFSDVLKKRLHDHLISVRNERMKDFVKDQINELQSRLAGLEQAA